MSSDLRDYFDVFEGIRCMLYGVPDEIPHSKAKFYLAYGVKPAAKAVEEGEAVDNKEMSNDEFFEVEKIVEEYTAIKKILENNSIPVDVASLESGLSKRKDQHFTKGWGMQVLFDKKAFLALLTELEQMRKLHQVKKKYYLFTLQYFGKSSSTEDWYQKVEMRTT